MTDLSPEAQAVRDAFFNGPDDFMASIAAALRAVADQVLPAASPRDRASWSPFAGQIRDELLAIAAELDPESPTLKSND